MNSARHYVRFGLERFIHITCSAVEPTIRGEEATARLLKFLRLGSRVMGRRKVFCSRDDEFCSCSCVCGWRRLHDCTYYRGADLCKYVQWKSCIPPQHKLLTHARTHILTSTRTLFVLAVTVATLHIFPFFPPDHHAHWIPAPTNGRVENRASPPSSKSPSLVLSQRKGACQGCDDCDSGGQSMEACGDGAALLWLSSLRYIFIIFFLDWQGCRQSV